MVGGATTMTSLSSIPTLSKSLSPELPKAVTCRPRLSISFSSSLPPQQQQHHGEESVPRPSPSARSNRSKKLEASLNKYAPDSVPALAIKATVEKTKRRFDNYGKLGLLCGSDGLPHLIVNGDQRHWGEFITPGLLFLYIAGCIGWVGRSYLIAIRDDKKPTMKEIIIDVPLATRLLWSGFIWPVAAYRELVNGSSLPRTCDRSLGANELKCHRYLIKDVSFFFLTPLLYPSASPTQLLYQLFQLQRLYFSPQNIDPQFVMNTYRWKKISNLKSITHLFLQTSISVLILFPTNIEL
ncbi:hypothetical protein B296_00013339 [Ensete ventricosum]|uniref:Photosystem I reaction center subunit III n=1 Tax=Ensete ventricosum TaxID=4639 RepID=A0A426XKZ6_ENSVE|nr:hypothetical protein B296_00013339 [Ensete ventricosum]